MSKADLLEAWGDHLTNARRRSPHTVRAYLAAANRLLVSTGAQSWQDVAAMNAGALRLQLAQRRNDGLGNVSTARELSALKGFLTFAREQLGEDDASAPRLRGPRVKKGLPAPSHQTTQPTWQTWSMPSPATAGSARETGRCC